MTTLSERIQEELVRAMRLQDKHKVSALRMIRAALQNREIDKRAPLSDAEVIETLSSLVKKAKESIEQFRLGGRTDLVSKEENELQIILSFLPKQMEEAEIREHIRSVIRELGAEGPKDLGPVMKSAMVGLKGRADGKLVQQLAREILASPRS
ncbi:MAG: GatB/YqeY domain-containing protein [Thermodesulfobacteriota bacterium]